MASIHFSSTDRDFIQNLNAELAQDLQRAGIADDLQASQPAMTSDQSTVTRGDPVTWMTVVLAAAGAGGALTALLGKDGFLSALARVLEKYVEGRQAEVIIETDDGKKIQVSGPVGEIKTILQQLTDKS